MLKIKSSKFILSAAKFEQVPEKEMPEFAFIGRSNVGKSSLINTLLGTKKMVKVSNTPGKTQLLNFFEINQDFYLVDLPGYGYAKASKSAKQSWSKNIKDYLEKSQRLVLLFLLVDSRHGLKETDYLMIEFLNKVGVAYCIIATKRDKLSGNEWAKQQKLLLKQIQIEKSELIAFSSVSKVGKEAVLNIIEQCLISEEE